MPVVAALELLQARLEQRRAEMQRGIEMRKAALSSMEAEVPTPQRYGHMQYWCGSNILKA